MDAARPQEDEFQLQRSRNGCLTCRARRVKCDEGRPICDRCKSGNRECGYGPEKPPNPRKRRKKTAAFAVAGPPTSHSDSVPPATPLMGPKSATPMGSVSMSVTASTSALAPAPPPLFPPILSGDIDWISSDTRQRLMKDPTFLHYYFPRLDEMLTFRNYIDTAEDLIAFIGPLNERSPFNPWVTVHAPLIFQHPPGVSRTTDAIRLAVLAVGAVRLRFREEPDNPASARRIASQTRERVLHLLQDVIADPERNIDEVEGALAAMLSCTVACTLSADNGWDEMLTGAVKLVDQLGGADKLVARSPKDQFSPTRFVLEQLAVRDVVSCMTLGRRPSIIRQAFEPWFFEIERCSAKEVEWESIERQFGVSRGMVDVMARACSLIGVAREMNHGEARAPRELQEAANGLLAELQVWDHGFNYSPFHVRVQYGNSCYRTALRIALMRDVLGLDHTDKRVVSSAHAIIELARELDFEKGPNMNWLLWPLLLAGFHIGDNMEMRTALLDLLEHPGPQMCFDTRAGIGLIKEYWAEQDRGVQLSHWELLSGELHRCLFAGW